MKKISKKNPKSCFVSLDKALTIIHSPFVTEKSTLISQYGRYGFLTSITANKFQIKQAIEQIFNVKVNTVSTLIQKGKTKRFRGRVGQRNDFKKAYVKLEKGYNLDLGVEV